MARKMNTTQASVAVMQEVMAQMGRLFTDGEPVGGKIPASRVQHRVGSQVALDGFTDEFGNPLKEEECEGLVWGTVLRRYRTTDFPGEQFESSNCDAPRAILIQVGVARCSVAMDDHGNPPTQERMQWEAIRGLDDAGRLDSALCKAGGMLTERGIINGWAVDSSEPMGPDGGVVSWGQQAAFYLA